MENKKKIASFITGFLREFATIFTLAIIFFSLTGKIVVNADIENHGITTIYTLDGTGLPYSIIMQLFVFSLIMAVVSRFIFSEYFAAKLLLKWRSFLFTLVTFLATLTFSILFKWFPINNIYAWLAFIPASFGSYAIAIGLSFLLMKLEDKKYNKLLKEYKNKHKNT